jgi:hypothetical protein
MLFCSSDMCMIPLLFYCVLRTVLKQYAVIVTLERLAGSGLPIDANDYGEHGPGLEG